MSSFEDTIDLPPRRGKHEFRRRKRRPWYVSVLIGMTLLGLLVGIIGATVVYFYAKPRKDFANSLDMSQLEKLEVASIIYDRHGAELGRIFVQNRKPVGIAEIPEALINALIATEDERFYSHDGVDKIGIIRAVILNIQAREVTQGASTITQQLARNAFELKDRSISRKVTEAFLANRIEEFLLEETKDRRQMKRKVLELYLNRIYFGSGFYGVNAAANGYFGKEVHDLSTEECATLVGLIKSPNRLSPFNDPDESRTTRNIVFRRMLTEGYLTEAEVAELS
ncbi:MAG: transglycosylase domain-containing protein, partial [Verrucomicrobiales bacterium]|nr:transglycosylase domain-containing protein [Verrucomicrobiales bacterium]